jgi:cytochrome c biogenesis protein
MATPAEHISAPNAQPSATQAPKTKSKKGKTVLDHILDFLSSVKVGVFLLALLIIASAMGTIIIQKGTNGFTEYYASLLPAERELYEFLGFLDIYHTRWFNLLLLTVSLNIILASIDYFPAAWRYLRKPVLKINDAFVKRQPFKETVVLPADAVTVEKVKAAVAREMRPKLFGVLPISPIYRLIATEHPKGGGTTVLAERNTWNRLTAYAVHVALLTIFGGAFVGGMFGHKGTTRMVPGETANTFVSMGGPNDGAQEFAMPFALYCTDIEQNLLDPKKNDLSAPNTLDWHTRALIRDTQRGVEVPAHIHLNTPFDYRGYRLFQASFDNFGSARSVKVAFTPSTGDAKEYTITRQPTDIPGVGKVQLFDFVPDVAFQGGKIGSASGEYRKPMAVLEVLPTAAGQPGSQLYALPEEAFATLGNAPFLKAKTKFGDFQVIMKDFEKVSSGHILQVQYDPGVSTVYLGCAMLIGALWLVFFFAHQRLWVLVQPQEDGTIQLSVTGNTNRNRPMFEKRFVAIVTELTGRAPVSPDHAENERIGGDGESE